MKNDAAKIYGRILKDYRKVAGMTQEDIALQLGYTRQMVSAWETGKTVPGREVIEKIEALINPGFRSGEELDEDDLNMAREPELHYNYLKLTKNESICIIYKVLYVKV